MDLVKLAVFAAAATAATFRTSTPQMGWNSYNYYSCSPTEAIIKQSAQGLVSSGLAGLGYRYLTTDCGWMSNQRDGNGRLQWDSRLFPSGGKALGDFLHSLGLKFGVYSGGGYYQCGSKDLPASLGHEQVDAQSFAEWGADSLKYDNCYSISPTNMVDYTSPGAISPDRFRDMAEALNRTSRDIMYQICQWGVGTDLGVWASALGNSWRISNDIQKNWRSIWRITNQVVPFYEYTAPGHYPDMDMLMIGLGGLSHEEEKFHFGMWAINKSPLILAFQTTNAPRSSLEIAMNEEVVALNQDPLGKPARLVRRYTEEEYDVWLGELSNSRMVLGIANWKNQSQPISFKVGDIIGIESAQVRDVWAKRDTGTLSGTYNSTLSGHELRLLVLSNIVESSTTKQSTGYLKASEGKLSGAARTTACQPGQCQPVGSYVGNIGQGQAAASVTFDKVVASSSGTKTMAVDFVNYDVALDSAWDWGSSSRNMTIAVNGGKGKRWAFPISGGNWFDAGRLMIDVGGFKMGNNTVVFTASGQGEWAPDLVGFEILE